MQSTKKAGRRKKAGGLFSNGKERMGLRGGENYKWVGDRTYSLSKKGGARKAVTWQISTDNQP